MIVYNLFPLLAGGFPNWEKHLRRAAQMGFNWIYVNPIQRPGRSGSLYSIADYYDFNPLLADSAAGKGPREQLQDAVKIAETLGLNLMVDLVVNHSAADSDLVRKHPGWYVWEPDGSVAHPFAMDDGKKVVWTDLAKFDHRHTGSRRAVPLLLRCGSIPD